MYESHAINGVWLNTLGCETDLAVHAPVYVGGVVNLPYDVISHVGANTPRGNDYTMDIVISGQYADESPTALAREIFHERVQAIGALLVNDGEPFTLSRRLVLSTGDQTVETWAKYADGFDTQKLAPPVARAVVRLEKLWPHFYGNSAVSALPGTITPGGGAATNRMTITMSGATGQVLTNTTTGESITITAGSGTIVIDPFSRTATRSGVNNIGSVTFAGPHRAWMRLKPGANVMTLSSGTASITFYPAWL